MRALLFTCLILFIIIPGSVYATDGPPDDPGPDPDLSDYGNSSSYSAETDFIDPSGNVTTWMGDPVSGATVSALQDGNTVAETLTDENGHYSLPLTPGLYTMLVTAPAYIPETAEVDIDEPVTMNFELRKKSSIYGEVTDRMGTPIPCVDVYVLDSDYNTLTDTVTDSEGRYTSNLDGELEGQTLLRVMFSGDMLYDAAVVVFMGPDDAVRLDCEMERLTILSGTVKAPMTVASSLPVHIYCEDEYGLYDELTVFTDSSGYYIAEIHEDTVSDVRAVGVNTYGYHEYFDNITLNASEVNVKDIELSEKAVLRVTAVGTDGSPLDDVYFSVMNDEIYREMYGPYGNATFAVEEGEIHLTASKVSYAEYHETLNSTEEFSDHTVTMIRMGLPSGLEGHVTDARTGEPVANAQVTVWVYPLTLYTVTDENGYYCFTSTEHPALVSGTPVEVDIQGYNYRDHHGSVVLPEGMMVYDVDLERVTTLRGRITDPDDNMVFATLKLSYLINGSEQLMYGDLYGEDGDEGYLFYNIPESDDGLYLLRAEHWFYRPFTRILGLNSSEDNIHDIVMEFYDGHLNITVTDRNGTPLPGVMVNLQGPGYLQRITTSNGTADFLHLPDGEWMITTLFRGYVPANLTVNITGGSSEQILIELIRKGLPATLQGHVYDISGNPLSGARVYFWPSSHPGWTSISATTDGTGFYNLSTKNFPEMVSGLTGTLEIFLSHYRGIETWMIIDEGVSVYDWYLEPWSSNITFTVSDNKGNPVSTTLYVSGGGDGFTLTTSPEGTGVLNNVPPDEYWDVMCYDYNYFDWDGYYYVLEENQNLTVDIILVPRTASRPIQGRVTDAGGVPITGARVEIRYLNGNTPSINTFSTNSTGEFRSYSITANLMKIIISKDGYNTLERDMTPQDLPFDGVFVLETESSLTGRVEGYVRDFFDSPLEGVPVVASRPGFSSVSTSTDSSGYYRFDLPAGSYTFTPSDTRYIATYSVGATVAPDTITGANFTLLMKNSIYGYVNRMVPDNIIPASGATIELYNYTELVSTAALNDGRYQLQAPGQGEYNVRVSYPFSPFYLDEYRMVNLDGDAVNEDFILRYGPFSGIHGTVTDESTGDPLEGVLVTLIYFAGEYESYSITTLTDEDGAYSFTSLQPIEYYYSLDFIKDGYVPLDDFWVGTLQIGENRPVDVTLQPLMESSVSGTLRCWAGLLEGTVTLDDSISLSTVGGYFEFRDIIPGWHWLQACVNGSEEIRDFNLLNGQHLNIDIYFITHILGRNPLPGSILNRPFNVSALLFGARPGATGASIKLYSKQGEVPGTGAWDGEWLIFTPSVILSGGQYTAEVRVPGELLERWNFTYYPITDSPPRVTSVKPADGSFYRMPSGIDVTVNVSNDPGNGLSELSRIYMDGLPLQTTLTGSYGNWQLRASITEISHGWHSLSVVAVDDQGLEGYRNWQIFISTMNPQISNLNVTPAFSPGRQSMHITADISEPLEVIVSFDDYNYSLNLGLFTERIDGYWDGFIRDSLGSRVPPDGPINFRVTGYARDHARTPTLSATTLIDRTGPEVIADVKEVWNTGLIEITGLLQDLSGILSLKATASAGNIISWMGDGSLFRVTLSVPQDGKYNITLNVTDRLGNTALRKYALTVDRVAPEIAFSLPVPGSTVRPAQVITFSISDSFSGFSRGYLLYHSVRYPELTPWNLEVLLDGHSITENLIYSQHVYADILEGNTPYGYNYMASLASVQVTYSPRDHGFLPQGTHTVTVRVSDRAGNNATRELSFSSITGPPDITERYMNMTGSGENETLTVSFDVQENSDRGFASFKLEIDGVTINTDPTVIMDIVPYRCTVIYNVKSGFQQGPHTINFHVVDGHGLSWTLNTGFYHIEPVPVPLENIISDGLYSPDLIEYSASHNHRVVYDNSTGFMGDGSIYGYCDMNGPDRSLLSRFSTRSGNYILPMGGQLSFTVAETPFMDSHDADFLSLWMTDVSVKTSVYWGWGGAVLVYFNDGRGFKLVEDDLKAIAGFDKLCSLQPSPILYARHEAPWGTRSGILDTAKTSAIGADRKTWKQYIVKIPDDLDKSHLSVVFVWETVNWFQNSVPQNSTVSVSSRISSLEFLKTIVDYTTPEDGAVSVPLNYTIRAYFNVPMDPSSISEDVFHIMKDGFTVNGTAGYIESLNCAYFKPSTELGGLKLFTGYIGPDIRTVYGKILPSMEPYTWTFTTARGYPTVWEEIFYNGEKYQIFLVWGPGYNGGKPAYLGSPAYLSSIYGQLLEIDVVKYVNGKYYEVSNPDIRNIVFLGALRKSFYESLTLTGLSLIDQAQVDYVTDAASSILSDIAYYSWLIATFGQIPGAPDADDVIRASIARAIGSGVYQIHVPGYYDKLLNTFSTTLTGVNVLNDAYIKINKWLKVIPGGTEKNALSDVLSVLDVVDKSLQFQKDMVEYIFTLMWQLEVADTYRPQLVLIRDYTSGDTREALTELLTWDESSIMSEISGLILRFYIEQGLSLLKDEVNDVLMKTPAMPAVLIMKVLEKVVSYLKIFDFRSQAWTAKYIADASNQFIQVREGLIEALKYHAQKTPWDYSLISMASGLCYSTASDFFETRTEMVKILKRWPSLIAGTDPARLDYLLGVYSGLAADYRGHASNIIPDLFSSSRDLSLLLPLIKSPATASPTYIHIGAFSPVTLLITAPDGRRIGYDPLKGIVNDFGAEAFYNSPYSEPQAIVLPMIEGEFRIQLYGVDSGSYRIILEVLDENMEPLSGSEWIGEAVPGMMKSFSCFVDGFGSSYRHDATPPVITVTGVRNGGVYTGTVRPVITVSDDNLESWISILNGDPYTGGPVTAPGTYYMIIRASDGVNIVYSLIVFTIKAAATPGGTGVTPGGVFIEQISRLSAGPVSAGGSIAESVINMTAVPGGQKKVVDYTWLLAGLLVSVLIAGLYSAIRKMNK